MEIKDIIDKSCAFIGTDLKNAPLKSTDTVYQALNVFRKLKVSFLPVSENDECIGALFLADLLEEILELYNSERDRRHKLNLNLNHCLTKLQNLIEKTKMARRPIERQKLFQISDETIAEAIQYLK